MTDPSTRHLRSAPNVIGAVNSLGALRRLEAASDPKRVGTDESPRLCLFVSGREGVGATSLAVNLAVALADQGARAVLVDANVRRARVAGLCGLSPQSGIADIQAARYDIHEVLVRGPAGLLVLPGENENQLGTASSTGTVNPTASVGSTGSAADDSRAHVRLIRQLRSLRRHADFVLIDLGFGTPNVMQRYWDSVDEVVLVTTPDAPAVLDTYATVKALLAESAAPRLRLLVNRASDDDAADVHRRFDQSCSRFLGVGVDYLGATPNDESMTAAERWGRPMVLTQPDGPAAMAIGEIAKVWQLGPERALAMSGVAQGSSVASDEPAIFSGKSVSRPTSKVW